MAAPVILVTGVSRGIGRAIAEELQSRGAAVVGAASNVADVPATASLLPVAADVTQEAGRKAIPEAALARHGRIGLVNNVGTAFRRASVDTALEDFRQVLEVNLLATFALCCAAHPHLKASRGSVVNVSSVTGSRVLPVRIASGTSKAALDHLTRSLAVEWGADGIRVNAVLPGFTRTEMVRQVVEDRDFERKLIAATPLRRLAESSRVEAVARELARQDLVVVVAWIGLMKFTAYETEGIRPFVANSPLMSWVYGPMSVRGFSAVLGVVAAASALLIAARPFSPRASALGSALAVGMFLTTLSFLVTTPGVWEPNAGGFPALSAIPGQFLIKDLALLGISLWSLGEAWQASERGDHQIT